MSKRELTPATPKGMTACKTGQKHCMRKDSTVKRVKCESGSLPKRMIACNKEGRGGGIAQEHAPSSS